MSVSDLVERMRLLPGVRASGNGVNSAEIDGIESTLGIVLPADFKEFLLSVGWFTSQYFSLWGMYPGDEDNIVAQTLINRARLDEARQSKWRRREEYIRAAERLPPKAIVVNDGGDDSWYYLYSTDSDRPGVVVYLDGDMEWREDESWPSFTAYLEHMIGFAEARAREELG